jgi:hypothetical protein
MRENIGVLHRHPHLEYGNLPGGHMVVDSVDWEEVRKLLSMMNIHDLQTLMQFSQALERGYSGLGVQPGYPVPTEEGPKFPTITLILPSLLKFKTHDPIPSKDPR